MNIIRKILGLNSYQPLNLIEISKENLLQNYKYLSSLQKGVKIAPVLKSNAYGHGLVQVAKILDSSASPQNDRRIDIPFFCVDSLYEAYELYKAKIKTPILIMGYIQPENLRVKKLAFSYAVSTLDLAEAISKYQPQAGVHIFVDTGMHREGIPLNELTDFLKTLPKNLKIVGLMSHLASADDSKDSLNKTQIRNFQKALNIVKKHGFHPKWIHLQNSDGLNLHPKVVNINLARTGLALFGISKDPNLKQVLTFKSKIIQIKNLEKGDRVGYSGTFRAKRHMVLGVLPLGYFDGVDRRLSNVGSVLVDGVDCRIVGRVSMNITTVDISKVKNPHIGQEVLVYGSIINSAKFCKTIPYDLLVHLASTTKRIVV